MNDINFLPASYLRKQRRGRRVVIECLIVLTVAAGAVAWHLGAQRKTETLRKEVAALENQTAAFKSTPAEATQTQAQFRTLANQVRIRREVSLPVGYAQIMATLSQLMPQSIALTDLTVTGKPPSPAPPVDPNDTKKKPKKSKTTTVKKEPELLRVELGGFSPDDDRIADFVGKLSGHPLFSNVKMEFAKSIEVDGIIARQFQITLQVPTDCRYEWPARREGLADAN